MLGLLSGAVAVSWPDLLRAAHDRPLAESSGILVIVTLYGGNDGINTVIPHADSAYHDARPELAYAPGDVLHLDEQLGLNPGLRGLAQLWSERKLAIVRGVSYPQPDHSHFQSMDIWQTASPAEPVSTGWIARWLDATGGDPTRGRRKCTVAVLSAAATPESEERFAAMMDTPGADDPGDTPAMSAVCATYRAAAPPSRRSKRPRRTANRWPRSTPWWPRRRGQGFRPASISIWCSSAGSIPTPTNAKASSGCCRPSMKRWPRSCGTCPPTATARTSSC